MAWRRFIPKGSGVFTRIFKSLRFRKRNIFNRRSWGMLGVGEEQRAAWCMRFQLNSLKVDMDTDLRRYVLLKTTLDSQEEKRNIQRRMQCKRKRFTPKGKLARQKLVGEYTPSVSSSHSIAVGLPSILV